jgi:hypothetical protein
MPRAVRDAIFRVLDHCVKANETKDLSVFRQVMIANVKAVLSG